MSWEDADGRAFEAVAAERTREARWARLMQAAVACGDSPTADVPAGVESGATDLRDDLAAQVTLDAGRLDGSYDDFVRCLSAWALFLQQAEDRAETAERALAQAQLLAKLNVENAALALAAVRAQAHHVLHRGRD